jgi:hypothetical protein
MSSSKRLLAAEEARLRALAQVKNAGGHAGTNDSSWEADSSVNAIRARKFPPRSKSSSRLPVLGHQQPPPSEQQMVHAAGGSGAGNRKSLPRPGHMVGYARTLPRDLPQSSDALLARLGVSPCRLSVLDASEHDSKLMRPARRAPRACDHLLSRLPPLEPPKIVPQPLVLPPPFVPPPLPPLVAGKVQGRDPGATVRTLGATRACVTASRSSLL